MSYVLAFAGFAALIILHEAGHFVAAKAVGMRVERFSLFFGPMLVKVRRGETEYGIGPIPLGGYVRITGMNPHEKIPAAFVSRAYYNQAVWKRVVVIMAGPAVNLLIAFVLLSGIVWSSGDVVTSHGQPVYSSRVQGLEPPASQYLRGGDQIVAVDGKQGLSVEQITKEISSHRCAGQQVAGCTATTPVRLEVRRAGRLLTFTIYPRYDPSLRRTRIGFSFRVQIRPVGPLHAATEGVSEMWQATTSTVSTIARLFEPKEASQLHGVVGGFKVTQQRFAFDTTAALDTLGLISLSLAVVNLFPFLPLDGGHVFWALAEKVRGRRIPFEVMERAGVVGFVLIVLVFVIGLSNDISTLSGPGFPTR
ncbi:MAG: RIP metalloprotease [Solirubrobacterales bacterium]|nr:RIP metalloprotease [Solirubrobacterales bacterium]MBV9471942.1 RIP metalloprotease [Solirubrobacterales bacterium]